MPFVLCSKWFLSLFKFNELSMWGCQPPWPFLLATIWLNSSLWSQICAKSCVVFAFCVGYERSGTNCLPVTCTRLVKNVGRRTLWKRVRFKLINGIMDFAINMLNNITISIVSGTIESRFIWINCLCVTSAFLRLVCVFGKAFGIWVL